LRPSGSSSATSRPRPSPQAAKWPNDSAPPQAGLRIGSPLWPRSSLETGLTSTRQRLEGGDIRTRF
jgi:hypothetical protein